MYNSEDTPEDKYLAFEIKYDVKYNSGKTTSEKKWVALEKVNSKWIMSNFSQYQFAIVSLKDDKLIFKFGLSRSNSGIILLFKW